jgi:membrane fusion protein, multidrug efflux system
MFGEARLTLSRKAGVLAVPQSALQGNGDHAYVYAIENGKLRRKPVQPGMVGSEDDATLVEIVDGLAPGARIVRSNLGNLPADASVKVLEITSAAIDPASR